jgi:hypothetical protein
LRPDALPGATAGDRFVVRFAASEANPVTPENQTASATFALVEGEATIDTRGETLRLPADENASVSGTSTFAPGTTLEAQVWNKGGRTGFSDRSLATVRPDGTWETTVDLSGAEDGQPFSARVRKAREKRAETSGEVGRRAAAVTFDDQTAAQSGTLVTVDAATVEAGGFVVVHEGGPGGEVVGRSDYLEPGRNYSALDIRLEAAVDRRTTLVAVAYMDTDGDRAFDHLAAGGATDDPYRTDRGVVARWATVTPPGSTSPTATPSGTPDDTSSPTVTASPAGPASPSATTTASAPADATPVAGSGTSGTDAATRSTTSTTARGQGLVVALVALLAVGLAAARRN